jgi:hypothetical protein
MIAQAQKVNIGQVDSLYQSFTVVQCCQNGRTEKVSIEKAGNFTQSCVPDSALAILTAAEKCG